MGLEFVSVIVLAAGEARRFGSPKQLALLSGRTLLEHAEEKNELLAQRLSNSSFSLRPILILGAHVERVLPQAVAERWSGIEVCEDWRDGMVASINAGFKAALLDAKQEGARLKGVIVCLIDQPLVSAESLRSLLQAGLLENKIVCARYEDSIGPPAYFPAQEIELFCGEYRLGLNSVSGKGGAKAFILSRPHNVQSLGAELADVDTPQNLARLNGLDAQR